jgi:hypothetical protein
MVMEHSNHMHKDLDLWPKGSFCQILVESTQDTIVFEIKDELQSLGKRLDESLKNRLKMLDGTKQEINSMENKLHDMLTLQLGHHKLIFAIATTTSSMQCLFHHNMCYLPR